MRNNHLARGAVLFEVHFRLLILFGDRMTYANYFSNRQSLLPDALATANASSRLPEACRYQWLALARKGLACFQHSSRRQILLQCDWVAPRFRLCVAWLLLQSRTEDR